MSLVTSSAIAEINLAVFVNTNKIPNAIKNCRVMLISFSIMLYIFTQNSPLELNQGRAFVGFSSLVDNYINFINQKIYSLFFIH